MAIITGDSAGNVLFGTSGDDTYYGLGGDDTLETGLGYDLLDGGSGADAARYDHNLFAAGIVINNTAVALWYAGAYTAQKFGYGADTLVNVENFFGSYHADEIYIGGAGGTYSYDRAGDDRVEASQASVTTGHTFFAGSGNDVLIGSVASDTLNFTDDGLMAAARRFTAWLWTSKRASRRTLGVISTF